MKSPSPKPRRQERPRHFVRKAIGNLAVVQDALEESLPELLMRSLDALHFDDVASKKHDPLELMAAEIQKRFDARGVQGLRYYTPRFHQACFTLPEYLIEAGKREARVLTDADAYAWKA